jgi:hypothetical protein
MIAIRMNAQANDAAITTRNCDGHARSATGSEVYPPLIHPPNTAAAIGGLNCAFRTAGGSIGRDGLRNDRAPPASPDSLCSASSQEAAFRVSASPGEAEQSRTREVTPLAMPPEFTQVSIEWRLPY